MGHAKQEYQTHSQRYTELPWHLIELSLSSVDFFYNCVLCLQDLMVMGAPGTSYWTGSVLVFNTTSNTSAAYVDDDSDVLYGSYLGEITKW